MPARVNPSTTASAPARAPRAEGRRRIPAWHLLPPPDPALRIVVIVPVRNEAARLPSTLAALAAQRGPDGRRLDARCFEIIVLANNCSDDSAGVVRRFAARHPRLRLHAVAVHFPRAVAHVGHARACLMNEASRRLRATAGAAGIIASTDGDTRVAADWLAAIWHEIDAGADAVGGRIVLESSGSVPAGLARLARRDDRYQHLRTRLEHAVDPDPGDPWPRHHQHFGANLAVSAAAYARVGGLPAEPFLEDEAFYQALCAHDMKVRHSESIRVVTSSRRDGRVAVGLSWQLREWEALAASRRDPRVPDPRAWCAELQLRRRLRACWQAAHKGEDSGASPSPSAPTSAKRGLGATIARRVEALAARLAVPPTWLSRQVATTPTFGAVWASVCARRARHVPPAETPMSEAIATLRVLVERHSKRR